MPAYALSIRDYTPAEMREMEVKAIAGDVAAMVALGEAYAWGRAPGNGTDRASAIYWYGRAANLGSAEAQRQLGSLSADETRAFLWYQRAAEKGDVFAQGGLARIYEESATRADYGKGYDWTLKAALQGDELAVIRLQSLYIYKEEVATFDAALARLSDAADAGNPDAQSQLATVFMLGLAGHKDEARARALAEKAAAQNNAEGLYSLYFLLPREAKAERAAVLRRAADMGHVPAQLMWMLDYDAPNDVDPAHDPNERLIFDWLAAASEKGWPMAQLSFADYYRHGPFVEPDRAEALKWRLVAQHLPYHRKNVWLGGDPWALPVEETWEIEGHRRAEAWLKAHPKRYWQVEE
jgi:TPR repeat protein